MFIILQLLKVKYFVEKGRAKEFRMMRGFRLADTHRHLFKLVGELLDISSAEVEDFMLDDGKVSFL